MSERKLTQGEIKLAQSLFGDAIDYQKVTMYDRKINGLQPDNFNAAPDGNLYMIKNYTDDFSKSPIEDQAALLHELTHIWQRQNNTVNLEAAFVRETLKNNFNYKATNNYTLVVGKDFNEYGYEQQAGIVEDYILLKNNKETRFNQSDVKDIKLYEATLAKLLDNPKYAARAPKKGFFDRFKF